jgi:hypothetical protein
VCLFVFWPFSLSSQLPSSLPPSLPPSRDTYLTSLARSSSLLLLLLLPLFFFFFFCTSRALEVVALGLVDSPVIRLIGTLPSDLNRLSLATNWGLLASFPRVRKPLGSTIQFSFFLQRRRPGGAVSVFSVSHLSVYFAVVHFFSSVPRLQFRVGG